MATYSFFIIPFFVIMSLLYYYTINSASGSLREIDQKDETLFEAPHLAWFNGRGHLLLLNLNFLAFIDSKSSAFIWTAGKTYGFGHIHWANDPDLEYINFTESETLPSACHH